MSTYFSDSRDVEIGDANFSHVGRDQTVIRTIEHAVINVKGTSQVKEVDVESETLELSEFTEVKRGDIRIIKEIARHTAKERTYWWDSDRRTGDQDHVIYTAELNVIGHLVQESKFTVKTYHGPYALEDWRTDFSRYSRTLQTGVFGYNRSTIPSLIVWDELIPAAHVLRTGSGGLLKEFYLNELRFHLGDCRTNELWIDPSRGILRRGPQGPECKMNRWLNVFENLPPDIEFLQEDVFIRFMARFESPEIDLRVVVKLTQTPAREEDSMPTANQSTIISPTNPPIALGTGGWPAYGCLGEEHRLGNGIARFTLEESPNGGFYLQSDPIEERRAWLSQAESFFKSHGVSVDDDLCQYKLLTPCCRLSGRLSRAQDRRPEPIYFFVRPISATPLVDCMTGNLHYWSLDPDGQSPLDPNTCHRFGLPIELKFDVYPIGATSWGNEVYRLLRKYQLARGFDPSTTDFARSLNFPIYLPARNDSDRFEEVGRDVKSPSLWSTVSSLFSPTVSDDSDILTVGF